MGKYLGWWAPPVVWNFTPEQVQNPGQLVEHLEKVCCHPNNSRETRITATCWGLAHAHRALFNTVQYPRGEEKVSGSDNKATSTAATGTLVTGTTATPTPATGTAAEPENQPVPVSVAPIQKKNDTKKSVCLAKDGDEPGSSWEQEEEAEPEIITRSLSLSELWDMRKDFSCYPGEHVITWLLRCWGNGASSLELEGKEAKQLRSLSRDGGIDKAIGKGTKALSLWRQLQSSVKERYPLKEDVLCQSGKWTTMDTTMLKTIYYDPDNTQLPKDSDEGLR